MKGQSPRILSGRDAETPLFWPGKACGPISRSSERNIPTPESFPQPVKKEESTNQIFGRPSRQIFFWCDSCFLINASSGTPRPRFGSCVSSPSSKPPFLCVDRSYPAIRGPSDQPYGVSLPRDGRRVLHPASSVRYRGGPAVRPKAGGTARSGSRSVQTARTPSPVKLDGP